MLLSRERRHLDAAADFIFVVGEMPCIARETKTAPCSGRRMASPLQTNRCASVGTTLDRQQHHLAGSPIEQRKLLIYSTFQVAASLTDHVE
jgi:hypothetical protein